MLAYAAKSVEELRWEDYQQGVRGGCGYVSNIAQLASNQPGFNFGNAFCGASPFGGFGQPAGGIRRFGSSSSSPGRHSLDKPRRSLAAGCLGQQRLPPPFQCPLFGLLALTQRLRSRLVSEARQRRDLVQMRQRLLLRLRMPHQRRRFLAAPNHSRLLQHCLPDLDTETPLA